MIRKVAVTLLTNRHFLSFIEKISYDNVWFKFLSHYFYKRILVLIASIIFSFYIPSMATPSKIEENALSPNLNRVHSQHLRLVEIFKDI